jgi:hypothetical protein
LHNALTFEVAQGEAVGNCVECFDISTPETNSMALIGHLSRRGITAVTTANNGNFHR